MIELSILIPANKEQFLAKTIQDILENIEAETEIIAVLDSEWADPSIDQHERVTVIYVPKVIGQRAATNLACRIAKGKYVAKVDAHCAFDKGFDRKMLEGFQKMGDNVTMVPVMRNLHVFNWKCHHCGFKQYQGAKPEFCQQCHRNNKIKMQMVWRPRPGTHNYSYAFDSQPHFQYFKEYRETPEFKKMKEETGGYTESMSLQGSFFMCTKEKYWELNLSDEKAGSWGNQGIEVACKTWLSGGRVIANHNTWYAHLFRTQDGFSFPYGQSWDAVQKTKDKIWEFFFSGKFKQQIHPVSWLVEKFWPIKSKNPDDKYQNKGWTKEALEALKMKENNKK